MRLRPLATLFAAGALWAGLACAQQATSESLGRVDVVGKKAEMSNWFRAESQHFIVYSDTREDDVELLLDNLEKLDHLLRIYTLPGGVERPAPKLTLYFRNRVPELGGLGDGMPADAVGLYGSCTAGVQGFAVNVERISPLRDEQLEKGALDDTLSFAFEAYARHFLLRYTDIRTPASFIEGFAQYFSTVRFSEQQMVVGRTNRAVAGYLRFLGSGRKYSLEWEDVLENRVRNARNYGGDAGVRLEFEARSWLLTHYMMSSEENRRRQSRYLALVGHGESPTRAFERAFGIKMDDLGAVMWRYSLRGVQVLRVAPPALPVTRVSFRTLSRAAGEFVLADAALKACPSRNAGVALLKKVTDLASRFPDADAARLTLSRAQIDWGDPQEALRQLEPMLQDDAAGFEAEYLAGMANLRLAGRAEGDARRAHLQAAQRHLQQARALSPHSPEVAVAVLAAEAAASKDAPDAAVLQGVVSAWQTTHDVPALGRSAALAYAYAGQADEAHRTLGMLVQNLRGQPMAQWAKQWQGRLETGVSRGDILAEMRRTDALEASIKEWTVDKQGVLQKVELAAGLEDASSFIKQQQQQQQQQGQGMQPGNPGGSSGPPR
jgi:hypothetical protein